MTSLTLGHGGRALRLPGLWRQGWPLRGIGARRTAAWSFAVPALASRWPPIRFPASALTPVQTVQFAQLAREHNNANVIGFSGRFVPLDTNEQIVDTFLTAEFAGGRHAARVEKIMREDASVVCGSPRSLACRPTHAEISSTP